MIESRESNPDSKNSGTVRREDYDYFQLKEQFTGRKTERLGHQKYWRARNNISPVVEKILLK